MSVSDVLAEGLAPAEGSGAQASDLAAVSYSEILHTPRRWIWPGHIAQGEPVVYAAAGGVGKGMVIAAAAARTVLGLPFPNEDQDIRRAPGSVIWITSPGEDDPYTDLAVRLRAAIAAAVEEFGLDPELSGPDGAIRHIHDLSTWQEGTPVTLPGDCGRVVTEIRKVNALGGPAVVMVVADSLSGLLSDKFTINSRQGAYRVMGILSAKLAQPADVALVLVHHLTRDGKVAGSPAVLNALRLAFRIERVKDDPDVRVIIEEKANNSSALPERFTIAVNGPATHAVFLAAEDTRAQRLTLARERAALPVTSARTALASGGLSAIAGPRTSDPGAPFCVMRVLLRSGQTEQRDTLPGVFETWAEARAAADRDAGAVLDWQQAARTAGLLIAAVCRADGARANYGIAPARMVEAAS